MAKLKHGIFGPISGKIGPVVGGSWKGIPYVRSANEQKENPKPRSVAQIANEQKMVFINGLLMPFHPYVEVGFKNLAIRKTSLSAAYSHTYHKAITGVYPDLGVDYSKMLISKGDLPGLKAPRIELIESAQLKITWEDDNNPQSAYDDQLMLMVYCPELHMSHGFIGGVARAAKMTLFTFDPKMKGKTLEVYLSITSLNRKKIAGSVYMGRIQS